VRMSNPLYTAIESTDKIDIFFSNAILCAKLLLPDAVIPVKKYNNYKSSAFK